MDINSQDWDDGRCAELKCPGYGPHHTNHIAYSRIEMRMEMEKKKAMSVGSAHDHVSTGESKQ